MPLARRPTLLHFHTYTVTRVAASMRLGSMVLTIINVWISAQSAEIQTLSGKVPLCRGLQRNDHDK
jgi:hypothetical protein